MGWDTGWKPMLTQVPFVENDRVLGTLDERFGGNYLHKETLISFAAIHGYNTAVVGKLGPILIQDVPEANPLGGLFSSRMHSLKSFCHSSRRMGGRLLRYFGRVTRTAHSTTRAIA
jgi:hypothetical protein